MKAAKSTTLRRVAAALIALASLPTLAAETAAIRVEDGAVEPLAGRDYNMRVDVAASRFERYDTASGRTELAAVDTQGARALAPGLWLAVPQARADAVTLLPLGANPSTAAANVATLKLPAAIVEHLHRDGGVIYVDADARIAAAAGAR